MKVAFVVSWLNQHGGAERVLEAAHQLFPDAPVYTSIFDPRAMPKEFSNWDIRVSFLDRLPGIYKHHQWYLPFYPFAFQSFNLSAFDLILSITSAFAHGVNRSRLAGHICYCLTPARFIWGFRDYVSKERIGTGARELLPVLVNWLRRWDRSVAQRVDEFIAISSAVQKRISTFYGRESKIIYPPVDLSSFRMESPEKVEDYFLIVSRLVPYKQIDIAVEAFNRLELPLIIAGEGRDRPRLEGIAKSNVRFLGRVSDEERRHLMARCLAFIFPGQEDFGIAPLEANATGRPVIAYGAGGALDTITPGLNGILFYEPTVESLMRSVRNFNSNDYDPLAARTEAAKFDVPVFQDRFRKAIDEFIAVSPHPQQLMVSSNLSG